MRIKAKKLIGQVQDAQKLGTEIIARSGIESENLVYCFATSKVLVINCPNYETMWRFEEGYSKLLKAIATLESSIDTICLELRGKLCYKL